MIAADESWNDPPDRPQIGNDEVHVWRASLVPPQLRIEELTGCLDAEELARAGRFHFQTDRDRYVVGRAVLREILGRYVNVKPASLRFSYGARGKPALDRPSDATLRFNASHSGALALYAVARGREIGVDIERIRPDFAYEEVAERFFARAEVDALRALPREKRREAFYTCWTRKEAYVKATGDGIVIGLDRFEVSLDPAQAVSHLESADDPTEASRWSLRSVAPAAGYAASVAAEGDGWTLSCWSLPERG